MDNNELIERLQSVLELLSNDERDNAESELYQIFDELEFISDDYDDDDDEESDYDDDYDDDE